MWQLTRINLLGQTLDGRLISRNIDVNWPLRNCDLTSLDYYMFGTVKEKCYVDKPIKYFKANIRDTRQKARKNLSDLMWYCEAKRCEWINNNEGSTEIYVLT